VRVIMLVLAAVLPHAVALHEDDDQVGRDLEEGLLPAGTERGEDIEPLLRCPLLVESATLIRRFTSGSETTTKCQGCMLAPLGALPAARRQSSMICRGTSLAEKCRTVRRRHMSAAKSAARRRISSGGYSR
jgi:hypothetical protein